MEHESAITLKKLRCVVIWARQSDFCERVCVRMCVHDLCLSVQACVGVQIQA